MKRYQLENFIPSIFALLSIYIIVTYPQKNLLFVLGSLLSVVGVIIWGYGKITLNDAFTAMPKATKLIKNGIYSKIRHPIYVGLSTMLFGWMILFNNWIAYSISLIIILTLIIRAYFEEKILTRKFGDEYIKYRSNTWF